MLLRKSPQTILRLGMLFLIVALLAQRFVHPTPTFSESAADALKGFLMGISIGLNLLYVGMLSRRRAH